MRIRSASTKVAVSVAGYAGALLVGSVLALTVGTTWGVLATTLVVVSLVVTLTRLFRGENESDAPRPWWRVTAFPLSGYLLGAWFALQGLAAAPTATANGLPVSVGLIVAIACLALSAWYLASSIRLSSRRRRTRFAS